MRCLRDSFLYGGIGGRGDDEPGAVDVGLHERARMPLERAGAGKPQHLRCGLGRDDANDCMALERSGDLALGDRPGAHDQHGPVLELQEERIEARFAGR